MLILLSFISKLHVNYVNKFKGTSKNYENIPSSKPQEKISFETDVSGTKTQNDMRPPSISSFASNSNKDKVVGGLKFKSKNTPPPKESVEDKKVENEHYSSNLNPKNSKESLLEKNYEVFNLLAKKLKDKSKSNFIYKIYFYFIILSLTF